jgi:RimJ/RimL family protein N-acetyltransferase
MTTTTAGVYMLAPEHADAIQRFAADPSLAATFGTPFPPSAAAGRDMVDRATSDRLAGNEYWSVVVDRNVPKGLCALLGPYTSHPELRAWIDPPARGHGYGALAVKMTLEFAFRNLQLSKVWTPAPADASASRTLRKFGFGPSDAAPNAPFFWSVTQEEFVATRDRPALASLHPDLRVILDAELAAGNSVVETGAGWPDTDSVFVRLREPFRTKPSRLPAGVTYTEPNDPHWWKADYSSTAPRHVLAC